MNWDELRELAAHPMVEIGAHTVSHPRLVWLDEERCRLELTESRLELEAELGRPVVSVAYPHGSERDVPAGISKLARDSGYIIGFTTIPRHLNARDGDRLLTLPRVGIGDSRDGLWGNLAWILGWPQHFNAGLCSRLRAVEDFR